MSQKRQPVHSYEHERLKRRLRYTVVFIALIIAMLILVILNINIGNAKISIDKIFKIIFMHVGDINDVNVIWKIRLPRIIMALLLGGALSLAGFLLQTFFDNPIAGPFVLGISSGAKMTVAITMIIFASNISSMSSGVLIVAAFVGALMSIGFVLLFSRRIRNMATLLVAGIMIGYICSAVTDFVVTFAADSDIVNLHNWSKGSFSGMSWANIQVAAFVVLITFFICFMLAKPIGAYQLGEAYAQSMGVNIKAFRVALILISSLLAATVTAFAGPISFVGIAVPFLIKRGLNTSKPIVVIPATFLGGGVFCMGCDLIARTMFAPTELNISTVTSIFGAPIVIFMMLRRRRRG